MRPSALQRMYAFIWLFIASFALLAFVTVLVQDFQVAAGYPVMFYFAAVFFALILSYLELFFAPKKSAYVAHFDQTEGSVSRPLTGNTSVARFEDRPTLDDDATETTSLLRGDHQSFARHRGGRSSTSEADGNHQEDPRQLNLGHPYPGEQEWSGKIPSWLWFIQFLLLAPTVIVIVGQVALLLTSALYQTPADGNSTLYIYIAFAILTTLLLAPTGPFIHRFTYHVPTFLFLVCVATVIYNLVAFPFSREHRLKVYFLQQVDCESGVNTVSLTGLDGYVQRILEDLPSAQGKHINCTVPDVATRKELRKCAWEGLPAKVVPRVTPFSNRTYSDSWLDYSISKSNKTNEATISVVGHNTRACRVLFDTPITKLAIAGGVLDPRFDPTDKTGSRELRLWHREWSQPWNISVAWNVNHAQKLSGKIVCLWSDANSGDIPAFDEVRHYLPVWAIPTKISDGLVEGFKHFTT